MLNTVEINTQYDKGVQAITNVAYRKYAHELYGLRKLQTDVDEKLLLLLLAIDTWDVRYGASNLFTLQQMLAMMDCIYRLSGTEIASKELTDTGSDCGTINTSISASGSLVGDAPSLSIVDTNSVDLTLANNLLSALVKVSNQAGNTLVLNPDGLYSTGGAADTDTMLYLTGADFVGDTYNNAVLAGKDLKIWHRGLGYLIYDPDNPESPDNEFVILPTGGFRITIPGFDVNAGLNHFYVSTTLYA